MEDDLQRPYFVCTRDDLKEKMNKQINDISEIFCVSNSDVTALLMKLRWNSQLLSERLCQENNKLSTESGFVTDSNQDLSDSDSSCDDVDDKVSTPFCSHEFSINYWNKYLEKNKKKYTISCPLQGCPAEVEWDAIENLTVRKKNRYDEYVLRSYLEKSKRQIKQCPAQGCRYFIEFPSRINAEEYGLNVVCLCGHTFCWRCSLESHNPVTCNNASGWLSRDLKKLSVSMDDTSCLDRWEACEASMEKARSELQAFEESKNTTLREGLMLIVQCRQFLKWSCVYEYIHLEHEDSKKDFLRFLQDYASTLVQSFSETLKEEREKALSETTLEEVTCSKGNLYDVTISIGNYFYNFAKALQDGLDVVEVRHYDDFSPCWLCDRCTYANTWLHKVCQMCYEIPVEKPSGSFLNKVSS
ncbi:hypothetical protein DY000_02005926 [Brassica cretica]|uniref:RBR-type E3 ubiquitin transferase n=1 Tax=Brassica cretica TaxID=69181 RepID=A0ABQ7CDJ4_BRACR|nr:hypothetical protein DY000_02005926 [Brassica cretica]